MVINKSFIRKNESFYLISEMNPLNAFKAEADWRAVVPSIMLVLNSFVWYIFTSTTFSKIVTDLGISDIEKMALFVTYYIAVAATAIIGAKLFPRQRTKLLFVWSCMGALATFLLIPMSGGSMLIAAFLTFFLGASIGIGLPSCLSYFADSAVIEHRGLASGVIWSIVGIAVVIFAFVQNILGLSEMVLVLTAWRVFGMASFFVSNRKKEVKTNQKKAVSKAPPYLELIRKKEILLYLFPWVMFCLLNFAEAPIVENILGINFAFVLLAEWGVVGIVAVVGGLIADIAGRKRIVIAGFVMLGIEYAALSAFSDSPVTFYLFLILDGISWGLLASAFFTTIWGDLGEKQEKEKYYVLGGLPYLLANFLYVIIKPYASDISPAAAFSFASFFLFLAVLPLMYAPETLPEKKIRERELKGYLEKAKKEAEKFY
jgi:MFS family permease